MSGDFDRFLRIREMYAEIMPEWMEDYEQTGRMHHDPYICDWLRVFTPIEDSVWGDIRSSGIPFYPQLPVLNYFLDFGCPFLKIGIECDGKAWHDKERDRVRDSNLADAGWTIFRIEGHECRRVLPRPWNEYREEVDYEDARRWFMETSEGIVHAIKARYFDEEILDQDRDFLYLIDSTLAEHNTTPYVYTLRPKPKTPSKGPIRLSNALERHIDLLLRRANRVT